MKHPRSSIGNDIKIGFSPPSVMKYVFLFIICQVSMVWSNSEIKSFVNDGHTFFIISYGHSHIILRT